MKVGFDLSQIAHKGGVANYTLSLAEELQGMPDLEMVYFYSSLRRPYKGNLKNVKSFSLPPTLFEVLFNRIRNFPIENFIGEIDIFHSSDWVQPKTKAKKITTVHDLVAILHPEWSHPKIVNVQKRRLKLVEDEIDHVIAVSQATKQDLLEVSKIPSENITVIYEGISEIFKPHSEQEIEKFKKKYNLPDKFILSIGGIGERRNLKRIKEATKDYDLVISGETIPYLDFKLLPLLYSSSEVLLYPSLYEGFGLPIIEAMATGTPVITSNRSSMKEIADDAAFLVEPENIDGISQGIKEVLENKSLRENLRKKGIKRAKDFSWKKCAKETAEVYRKLSS